MALALRAAMTIFWHHPETQGLTSTDKVKSKVNKNYLLNDNLYITNKKRAKAIKI